MSAGKGIEVEVFPTLGGMVIIPLKQYEELKAVQAHLFESLEEERKKRILVVQAFVKDTYEEFVRLSGDIIAKSTEEGLEKYSDYVVGKATEIYNMALSSLEPDGGDKP